MAGLSKSMFANLKKSAADTQTDSIKMINVCELHESPNNFFVVDRVEELAETILVQGGVKDNLVVTPRSDEDGGYEIVSGHRRTAAVRYLLEKGEKISPMLTCLVVKYDSEDDKNLDLTLMNISARVISDEELYQSFEIINDILKSKRDSGVKVGKLQHRLAEMLGVSYGQAAKLQRVDKNAPDEVKNAIKSGKMSVNAADKLVAEKKSVTVDATVKKPKKATEPKPELPDDVDDYSAENGGTHDNSNYNNSDENQTGSTENKSSSFVDVFAAVSPLEPLNNGFMKSVWSAFESVYSECKADDKHKVYELLKVLETGLKTAANEYEFPDITDNTDSEYNF